jgi:hypothetical protein
MKDAQENSSLRTSDNFIIDGDAWSLNSSEYTPIECLTPLGDEDIPQLLNKEVTSQQPDEIGALPDGISYDDYVWFVNCTLLSDCGPQIIIRLCRRLINRAFDLVGVEENPGPVTGKKLSKLLRQTGIAIPPPAKKKNKAKKKQSVPKNMVAAASAYSTMQNSGKAQVFRNTIDSCRMVHRELIASITGSTAFTTTQFAINPGLVGTFPWLSIEAQGWEKYKFNSLRFCTYTRTGTSTPGSQSLIVDYDAADSAPASEEIASTYYGTIEDAPWKDSCMELDKARLSPERFLRSGTLASNLDIKTYDVGNFYLGTSDGTAVSWSKLWVEYDVTLINPQLPSSGLVLNTSGTLNSSVAQSSTALFGTTNVVTGPFTITGTGTNIFTISGLTIGVTYVISLSVTGTVLSVLSATFTGDTSAVVIGSTSEANASATAIQVSYSVLASATTVVATYSCTGTTVTAALMSVAAFPVGAYSN